jgi:ABC-type transport system substrate-binding protein
MDPTDQSNLHMLAQVLHQHMNKVGLNVDLQAMDWSTLVSRRAFRAWRGPARSGCPCNAGRSGSGGRFPRIYAGKEARTCTDIGEEALRAALGSVVADDEARDV